MIFDYRHTDKAHRLSQGQFWALDFESYWPSLKPSYFESCGGHGTCMGRNFWKSVGILWAAIAILCYFHKKVTHPAWAQNNTGCQWQLIIFPLKWKNVTQNSHQNHLSIQNIQVFSWALDAPIISLNNALFYFGSLTIMTFLCPKPEGVRVVRDGQMDDNKCIISLLWGR